MKTNNILWKLFLAIGVFLALTRHFPCFFTYYINLAIPLAYNAPKWLKIKEDKQ